VSLAQVGEEIGYERAYEEVRGTLQHTVCAKKRPFTVVVRLCHDSSYGSAHALDEGGAKAGDSLEGLIISELAALRRSDPVGLK